MFDSSGNLESAQLYYAINNYLALINLAVGSGAGCVQSGTACAAQMNPMPNSVHNTGIAASSALPDFTNSQNFIYQAFGGQLAKFPIAINLATSPATASLQTPTAIPLSSSSPLFVGNFSSPKGSPTMWPGGFLYIGDEQGFLTQYQTTTNSFSRVNATQQFADAVSGTSVSALSIDTTPIFDFEGEIYFGCGASVTGTGSSGAQGAYVQVPQNTGTPSPAQPQAAPVAIAGVPVFDHAGILSQFCGGKTPCPPPPKNTGNGYPAQFGWYDDPIFGSRVTRVTAGGNGNGCLVPDSVWSVFNADSSLFFVQCRGMAPDSHLFKLNKATGGVSSYVGGTDDSLNDGAMTSTGNGLVLATASASWSGQYPNIIYVLGRLTSDAKSTKLYRIDVSLKGNSRFGNNLGDSGCTISNALGCIKDFAVPQGSLGGTGDLAELGKSENDDIFTFRTDPPDDMPLPCPPTCPSVPTTTLAYAYIKSKDQLIPFPRQSAIHRTSVTKASSAMSGPSIPPSLVYVTDNAPNPNYFWNYLATNATTAPGSPFSGSDTGHYDLARNFFVAVNNPPTGVTSPGGVDRLDYTTLSASSILAFVNSTGTNLCSGMNPVPPCLAIDLSIRNWDERTAVVSTYASTDPASQTPQPPTNFNSPFDNELILASTDVGGAPIAPASQIFKRFASTYDEFTLPSDRQPHASVDRLGRYVAFTSDQRNFATGNFDVYLARVPSVRTPTVGGYTSACHPGSFMYHVDFAGHLWQRQDTGTSAAWSEIALPNSLTGDIADEHIIGGLARVNGFDSTSSLRSHESLFMIDNAGHTLRFRRPVISTALAEGTNRWFDLFTSSQSSTSPACVAVGNPSAAEMLPDTIAVGVKCQDGTLGFFTGDSSGSSWSYHNLGHPNFNPSLSVASDPAVAFANGNLSCVISLRMPVRCDLASGVRA